MPAWSVESLRASSRHYGHARVYGHTATVMRDVELTPTPLQTKTSKTSSTCCGHVVNVLSGISYECCCVCVPYILVYMFAT